MPTTATWTNCVSIGTLTFTGDFVDNSGTATVTANNCASGDLTADDFGGSGNLTNQTQSSWFQNVSGDNVELKPGSPGRNTGSNLSGSVDTDVMQRPRPQEGNYCIGAHEYPFTNPLISG